MNLAELIACLREIFVEDKVDVDEVRRVMEAYKSNPADWRIFAKFDENKYTRNLVDIGNGKYNLMIICWPPSMGSSIHDHTDAHCFVKVLAGQLLETQFYWPKEEGERLQVKQKTAYSIDGVSYMSDTIGLHRMENDSHKDGAVSLHLYIPPYTTCNAFDERTGRKTQCTVTFYSKYGQRVDYSGSKEGRIVERMESDVKADFQASTRNFNDEDDLEAHPSRLAVSLLPSLMEKFADYPTTRCGDA